MTFQDITDFKNKIQHDLGVEQTNWDTLPRLYEKATFQTHQNIIGVVQPRTTNQVSECLRLCQQHGIAVYPVSGGKNWGYGSRVPCVSQSLILDLSLMNKIKDYSENDAYVTLEPGVTQSQLLQFLKDKGDKLWMDVTTSSDFSSVVGNYLERGHGVSPIADHVSGFCNLEVVLPTGEIIKTGFGSFGNNAIAPLDRWGLGPSLDGLFSQSNLGVVTSMTVWLYPKPDCVESIFFNMDSSEQLTGAVNGLRPLKLGKLIGSGPSIVNHVRLFTSTHSYLDIKDKLTSDPLELALLYASRAAGIPLWSASVGLFGQRKVVTAQRNHVMDVLSRSVSQINLLKQDSFQTQPASLVERYWRRAFLSMNGKSGPFTKRPYWKKTNADFKPTADLDQDRVGFFWFPVTLPFHASDILRVTDIVSKIIYNYNFEPDLCFSAIRERSLQAYMSFVFDRNNPVEEKEASLCNHEIINALAKAGYIPHRLGIETMNLAWELEQSGSYGLKKQIKNLVDPKNILARGRYLD